MTNIIINMKIININIINMINKIINMIKDMIIEIKIK